MSQKAYSLHPPEDAKEFGVKDGQKVMVKTEGGERPPLVFDDVVARVREDFALDLHLDTDEANAAGLKQGGIWLPF